MAKTRGVKSQAIREHLEANPKAMAKEVVDALAEKGIEVTEGLVYSVKGGLKEKKQRRRRVVRAAQAAAATSNGKPGSNADAVTLVREVKALAAKAGGYEKLKELVDALAE